ncbi:MAG: synthase subunit epsilon [Bacteroidota bacterium]|jgi:F-type H+-transporting ATPase subunit epsilon
MKLDILSPEEEVFSGEVETISLPGISGRFQLLNHHAPIISALTNGTIRYVLKDGKSEATYEIKGGMVEMFDNSVVILVD